MRAGKRIQTFNINRTQPSTLNSVVSSMFSRNLDKYQLGGVIFGCKNSTMQECQSKQIFGLPAQHFSYVKNIDPGLPIFLFNYSDRKLHGIFEASSKGQMYIDPYAWIDDSLELDRTQYPAQVKFRVRLQCQPLSEDKFAPLIRDNYYSNHHFWFELDHRQAGKLISLLASLAFAAGCNLKWRTLSPSLPSTLKGGETFATHESKTHQITSSSRGTNSTEITSSLRGDIKTVDTPVIVKEVNENEKILVYKKLKELAASQNLPVLDNVNNTLDDICTIEKDPLEVLVDFEEKECSSSPIECKNNINQQEVEELTTFKKIQIEKNHYLEEKLRDALLQIQRLMDRCTMLESTFNNPVTENKIIQLSSEQHVDHKESFLQASSNFYCSFPDTIKSVGPKYPVHPRTSIIQLNDGSYTSILHKWTFFPFLNENKESLTMDSSTKKLFIVDDVNEIEKFSDVDLNKEISTCLMLDKRFAQVAVALNASLYMIGNGYFEDDGKINKRKTLIKWLRNIYVLRKVKRCNKNIANI